MDLLRDYSVISSIHGISDLGRAKSLASKIFWVLALVGVACFIPHNMISVLQDFQHAPSITFISTKPIQTGYPFPVIRFCPRSWVNSSRLAQSGLSRDAFLYALSLLYHVKLNVNVRNVTSAEFELNTFKRSRNIRLRSIYTQIAYDVEKIFDCTGCGEMKPTMTILGICYDFTYLDYKPDGTISRYTSNHLIYYPQLTDNITDNDDANNWYSPVFSTNLMYVDVNTLDFFAFDPLHLEINKSYEIGITPVISERLPGESEKPCLNEADPNNSFDQCRLDCTESLYGIKCRGYVHYGLATDTARTRENLSWYSSLKEYHDQDEETEGKCRQGQAQDLMKCIDTCHSACRQWQYDVQVAETNRPWRPLQGKLGRMTGAKYFFWRRHRQMTPAENSSQSIQRNMISVVFLYDARHGVQVIQETKRRTLAALISNVGGMVGRVAGASVISLWQLGEFFAHLFYRICAPRELTYSLGEVGY